MVAVFKLYGVENDSFYSRIIFIKRPANTSKFRIEEWKKIIDTHFAIRTLKKLT